MAEESYALWGRSSDKGTVIAFECPASHHRPLLGDQVLSKDAFLEGARVNLLSAGDSDQLISLDRSNRVPTRRVVTSVAALWVLVRLVVLLLEAAANAS